MLEVRSKICITLHLLKDFPASVFSVTLQTRSVYHYTKKQRSKKLAIATSLNDENPHTDGRYSLRRTRSSHRDLLAEAKGAGVPR